MGQDLSGKHLRNLGMLQCPFQIEQCSFKFPALLMCALVCGLAGQIVFDPFFENAFLSCYLSFVHVP